ncbi:putative siderophore-dependent iron transporter [Aaosphaeria arxii CBS 175.79]|uniref:Putative siderophore-dependent iron transporter n=1 Tax=Aaosphaeria arxii CBS 175.79 TaxID=1450172 RepID=A0A6A5XJ23_9PLEO|nr:putative siderophore-dependent iron transporter [Aaosphaeria arxii CBS 175.79]KAF2012866.1 putative siderophore-dependent iron transporter [Aaosphaeria arxii CBS 175.79]
MSSFLNKIRPSGRQDTEPETVTVTTNQDIEEQIPIEAVAPNKDNSGADVPDNASVDKIPEDAVVDRNAQVGVQKIEAVTLAWTKKSLILLLCNIWLIFFVNGLRASVLAAFNPYVTSDFSSHSLLAVIGIVTDAMTAAMYIPVAKLIDVWGRDSGFLLMVASSTLGVIVMATATNLATYCAAIVFYSIGFSGIIYVVAVLAADATSLRNRGIAFAFTSSPYMITAFAGSKAAEAFLHNVSWRWGYGCFAIIVPVVCAPMYITLKLNLRKAKRQGFYEEVKNPLTLQLVWKKIVEFDLPGVFLFAGGLTIFLLPFTLARSAPNGWNTGYVIAMIILGFFLLILFGVYETYWSPEPFLKNKFLTDRTVVAACLIDATYQISYYCWNGYFLSFLQVVCNLSVSQAGYVNSTFQVVSGVLLFIVGYAVRWSGRFKWLFYVTVPIYTFGLGLMIHFRQPNQPIGYIVMCEIFISIGGSVFILLVQLAVLAAVDHQYVAAVLALLYVSGSVGGAIGSTISGAIWTNTFLPALMRNLPDEELPNVINIYSNITAQLSYPVGSVERIAIQESYGFAQARMLAAGVGIFGLAFVWMFMVRNLNVSQKTGQTKGMVF